jgi:3-isopropylmalate/(R)-2-methylmalate dehydratase large subunit
MTLISPAPRTLYRKLVDAHRVCALDGDTVLLYVDFHLMNEYTSPQAFAGLESAGRRVAQPGAHMAVVDHIIPTHPVARRTIADPPSALQASNLKRNCEQHGLALYDTNDPLQGIEHIIAPELGMIRPGMVVLCGDSHTTTYGAFGALGFGIGTSEIEHVLATQTLVYRLADDLRVRIDGQLPRGTTAKDLVMAIVATLSARGARGSVVEFCGEAISALSMEGRMTLCNMIVEAGARGALIAPDATTRAYVLERAQDLASDPALQAEALEAWDDLRSDEDAAFDREVVIDASLIEPLVSWGTSPDQSLGISRAVPSPDAFEEPSERIAAARALEYMDLQAGTALTEIKVQRVFIGSCTNSRIEDLRAVAEVVRGHRVKPGVRAMVVPGSGAVRRQAEREGVAQVLIDAGFEWRQPGCSMCLAMNDDLLAPGERCASTTNRNFEGRQGRGGRTHLMSPAMAAAAAIAGHLVDVRHFPEARA